MLKTAKPAGSERSQRMAEIKELLGLFMYERMVYLSVTVISVVVLLACAAKLLLSNSNKVDLVTLLGLFGPSGGIIYATGRLLRMWNEALRILYPMSKPDSDTQ
jgi:hypothetical protein